MPQNIWTGSVPATSHKSGSSIQCNILQPTELAVGWGPDRPGTCSAQLCQSHLSRVAIHGASKLMLLCRTRARCVWVFQYHISHPELRSQASITSRQVAQPNLPKVSQVTQGLGKLSTPAISTLWTFNSFGKPDFRLSYKVTSC